jgi:hypothetical protein
MNNNWKKRATFLSRNCVTRPVGKDKVPMDFYAISPAVLFRLRGLSRPLTQALSSLFEDRSRDTKRTSKDTTDTKEGITVSETIFDAIDVEVLRERSSRKELALDRLVDAFSERSNYLLLLSIVWDSMRAVFGKEPPDQEELEALANDEDLDTPTLIDMLKGVAAANFDSLAGWSGKLSKALAAKLEKEIKGVETSLEGQTPTSSPTASANPLEETVSEG